MRLRVRKCLILWVVLAAALGGCRYYTETIPEKDTEDPLFGIWTLVAMQRPGAAVERLVAGFLILTAVSSAAAIPHSYCRAAAA